MTAAAGAPHHGVPGCGDPYADERTRWVDVDDSPEVAAHLNTVTRLAMTGALGV